MIVDGSDSNTATIALGYAEVIALAYSQERVLQAVERRRGPGRSPPLDVRPRVWFNAELESRNYIIPGLIAVIMMVIAALLTSLTVAREWERGTMEQLISTPVKGPELILGKLLPYFAIGMFDVLLAVLMGEFLFRVPLRGNVALIFGLAAVFLAGALSMGMLISIVHEEPAPGQPDGHDPDVSAGLSALGFRLSHRATCRWPLQVHHLSGPGPVFRHPAQGDLPERGGAGDALDRRRPS